MNPTFNNTPSQSNTSTGFVFPPSVQSDLFNYLKPQQQEQVKPILRVLKKEPQEELCCALMDFLETGERIPPCDIALGGLFTYITSQWSPLHTCNGCDGECHCREEPEVFEPVSKGFFHKFFNLFTL